MLKNFTVIFGSVLLLSACDTTKDALGLERNNPDEHTVLEVAPLTLPPNFYDMPEPQPGAPRPQDVSPQDMAKEAVLGTKTKVKKKHVAKAGIRQTVDQEARAEKGEKSFVKELVGIEDEASAKVINPEEEYEKTHGKKHPKDNS